MNSKFTILVQCVVDSFFKVLTSINFSSDFNKSGFSPRALSNVDLSTEKKSKFFLVLQSVLLQ